MTSKRMLKLDRIRRRRHLPWLLRTSFGNVVSRTLLGNAVDLPLVTQDVDSAPQSEPQRRSPTLGQVGEKALLAHLIPMLGLDERLLTGVGHDAAALRLDQSVSRLGFKIDRAARPVAFSRGWADADAWGRLAVTANCSDLLATGADPFAFMLSVTLPADWSEREYQRLVLGAKAECDAFDVVFAGGDTKEGAEPVVVGAAVGILHDQPFSRVGASPGDAFVVTGPIGGFLGAYLLLENAADASDEDRAGWIDYLARPRAHWRQARQLARSQGITAAVDTSDGVYDGIVELTRGTVGLHIDLQAVPWHPYAVRAAEELGLPLRNFLFAGGDWNLLYAVTSSEVDTLTRAIDQPEGVVRRLGTFDTSPELRATDGQSTFTFRGPRGEHFRKRLEDGRSFALSVATGEWFVPVGQGGG
jgi:thiamine-monophosphate kinase